MTLSGTKYIMGIPPIESIKDMSELINLSERFIYHLNTSINYFYKEVKVKRKNKKIRILACPSKRLKAVQAWILRNILDKISVEHAAVAYVKGKNLLDNLEVHKSNKFIICLDIENFFGAISQMWVYSLFRSLGYNKNISYIFANLCTYKGSLPQGGVTSPSLSNILCKRLDRRILGYTGARNIAYSRYADDITLSGNNPNILLKSVEFVKSIIEDEGFNLNMDKYRVIRPGHCRKITGLIISDDNICVGIGRRKKKELRAKIHNLKSGKLSEQEAKKMELHIKGWLSFLEAIDQTGYEQIKKYWDK